VTDILYYSERREMEYLSKGTSIGEGRGIGKNIRWNEVERNGKCWDKGEGVGTKGKMSEQRGRCWKEVGGIGKTLFRARLRVSREE
jgi:hypothetical protein